MRFLLIGILYSKITLGTDPTVWTCQGVDNDNLFELRGDYNDRFVKVTAQVNDEIISLNSQDLYLRDGFSNFCGKYKGNYFYVKVLRDTPSKEGARTAARFYILRRDSGTCKQVSSAVDGGSANVIESQPLVCTAGKIQTANMEPGSGSGAPDPQFGNNGKLEIHLPRNEEIQSFKIHQGATYLAGVFQNNDSINLKMMKYNSRGVLERQNTIFTGLKIPFAKVSTLMVSDSSAVYIGINSFAKIDGNSQFHLLKLNSDFSIDTKFGEKGIFHYPNTFWGGINMVFSKSGSLVIPGTTLSSKGRHISWLIQVSIQGKLDTKFEKNHSSYGHPCGFSLGVRLLADGKMISGSEGNAGCGVMAYCTAVLYKIDSTGKLDKTYGAQGFNEIGIGYDFQPKGHLVSVSEERLMVASVLNSNEYKLQRITANGNVDQTFGTKGKVIFEKEEIFAPTMKAPDKNTYLEVDSSDNLYLSGQSVGLVSKLPRLTVIKLDKTGKVAKDFGWLGNASFYFHEVSTVKNFSKQLIDLENNVLMLGGIIELENSRKFVLFKILM